MTEPDHRILALQRAARLVELKRYADAASSLRMLLASEPHDIDALAMLAQAQLGDSDPQGALMSATQAIALAPEAEWPHRLASIACTRLAMHPQAIAHADEAVLLNPGAPEPYLVLAEALVRGKSDLVRARQAALRAVTIAPDRPGPHLVFGTVAAAAGDRSDAETAFRRALEIDPQNTAAHNELGRLQLKQSSVASPSRLAAAATGFATAVQTDPRARGARWNLDRVVRVFLSRLAYLIFLDAYFVARLASTSATEGARLLPVALLGFAGLFALRFISRLDASLRNHLRRMLVTERGLGAAATLETVACVLLVLGSFAPQSARIALSTGAAVTGVLGRILLLVKVDKDARTIPGRAPRAMLGTQVLWILAAALALMAAFACLATVHSHAGVGGIGIAVVAAAGCIATLVAIQRRRTTSPGHS